MNNKIHTLNVLNLFSCPSKIIIVHCVVKKLFHPMCRSGPIKDILEEEVKQFMDERNVTIFWI
jgi:hypothetical protein